MSRHGCHGSGRRRSRIASRELPARGANALLAAVLLATGLLLAPGGGVAAAPAATHGAATPTATSVDAAAAQASAVVKALDYLHAHQNADGGFAEKGASSSDAITAWAIVAITAAGEDPAQWRPKSASPVDFLFKQSAKWRQPAYKPPVTDIARTVLAVVAAGRDPRDFGGVDLVRKLEDASKPAGDEGERIGPYVNSHIWAMIALKASGETPSDDHAQWLVSQQNADGGWGWAPGLSSDTNDTAAALQALVAAGTPASSEAVKRALAYLGARQADDGGFVYTAGSAGDANSTAWVVQGLLACGQSPAAWRSGGTDPQSFLRSLQAPEGYVRSSKARANNPLLTTVQVIPALSDKTFVIAPSGARVPAAFRPTITVTSPPAGATVAGASSITFTVGDGVGTGVSPAGVTVRVDGKKRAVTMTGATARASFDALAPGEHVVSVTAVDRAGNQSTLSGHRFTVAVNAPSSAAPAGTGSPAAAADATALDQSTAASESVSLAPGVLGDDAVDLSGPGATASVSQSGSVPASGVAFTSDTTRQRDEPGIFAWWWIALLVAVAFLAGAGIELARRKRRP